MRQKEPLYRRVNTRTRNVRHGGGEFRWSRNIKGDDQSTRGSMHAQQRNGLDYTPLFMFLLSKIGKDWSEVHSQAVARLDRTDPIFWMVARSEMERRSVVRIGESSYFSGLYVDDENRLSLVDAQVKLEDMKPGCSCCTHTFNGRPFIRSYED